MNYSKEALDDACCQLKKKLMNYNPESRDTTEVIVKKSKTMYIVVNRKKKEI